MRRPLSEVGYRVGPYALIISPKMPREKLILLLTQAFERAADRLRTEGHDDPWPDDLWPQELVRLLREHSRAIIASLGGEGIDR